MTHTNNTNNIFQTEHLLPNLQGRSVRGGIITVIAHGGRFLLQIGSTIVLARILTPDDYGLIAMVLAITAFVSMFKDAGLSMATVQREHINHDQVSTLFWINVAVGLFIMLLTASLAPLVSWFYGDTRLTLITVTLSTGFFFGGLAVQHQALLRRQMRFSALAFAEVVSMLVGISSGIVSALMGLGYWSLIVIQITIPFTLTVCVWLMCGWRPGLPKRSSGVKSMLFFGGNLTGFNFLNYFGRNLDNVLIGKFWGVFQLGLYSKAYQLLLLPLRQINMPLASVAIPALSRLQKDHPKYKSYYCKTISIISYATIPFVVVLAVFADEIILIILGSQWIGAGRIFRVFSFACLFQPLASTTGWIYISLGQTKRMMVWGLISVPLIIISFFVGLPWGAYGVSISYTICFYLLLIPSFAFAYKFAPISLKDLFLSTWKALSLSCILFVVLTIVRHQVISFGPLAAIMISTILGLVLMGILLFFWHSARLEIFSLGRLVLDNLKTGRKQDGAAQAA